MENEKKVPRVYISQENPTANYDGAKEYGELFFITNKEFSPNTNSLQNEVLIAEVDDRIVNFDPFVDTLVLGGSPITMGYVFHLAIEKAKRCKSPKLSFLMWNSRDKVYRQMDFVVK